MQYKDVYTQQELERAIADSFTPVCRGNDDFVVRGSSQVRAYDNSQVTACGSSQVTACGSSQVRAYGSSQVTACGSSQVTACGSSQVRAYDNSQVRAYDNSQVTACGSSQVTACGSSQVRAYDNSQVRAYDNSQVTACGSSQVRACGSSQVRATQYVAVTIPADFAGKAMGGAQIKIPPVKTPEEWCEFYGVEVKRGVAILYKGVDEDYSTDYARAKNISYKPGEKPEASDWNPIPECGCGLHFSPTPAHALRFNRTAKHFVACPVLASEIIVHFPADYPEKVKAPRVYRACYEVDINGNPIGEPNAADTLPD